jgi:hypothetical protein
VLNASQLAWPGVDKQRADAAAFHLIRALDCAVCAREYPIVRHRALAVAGEHERNARGYLGAIGFEHAAGLWR